MLLPEAYDPIRNAVRLGGVTLEAPEPAGQRPALAAYIDDHIEEHVAHLQRWMRQPSVSAEGLGMKDMAALLRDDLVDLGFADARLVPTDGHPGVVGSHDAGAERTVAVYIMYDVQPVEPADWSVPAFGGELVDHPLGRVLMARGAANQKGPERAFLNAVASLLAVEGSLPVNLLVVAEGEEELGSPHGQAVVDACRECLAAADAVLLPTNGQNAAGEAELILGAKGLLYLELSTAGSPAGGPTRSEIHGSYRAIVDSPVWRLVHALASLLAEDGTTIAVPGYLDAVRPPSAEERRLLGEVLAGWDEATLKTTLGVERWIGGWDRAEALERLLCSPTLNIDGIRAGYAGPGMKTILPHRATAKLDSRLVPDQTPEEAVSLIRRHLDRLGFADVAIEVLAGYPPAQTPVSSLPARAAIDVFTRHGCPPVVLPRVAGSAPYHLFTALGLPAVGAGLGHGAGAHAPDEYMVIWPAAGSGTAGSQSAGGIKGLAGVELAYADLLHALAGA
jgi:acetylornithine deacetylase/succinyl-diaminopimelate desuccinylase-like protein